MSISRIVFKTKHTPGCIVSKTKQWPFESHTRFRVVLSFHSRAVHSPTEEARLPLSWAPPGHWRHCSQLKGCRLSSVNTRATSDGCGDDAAIASTLTAVAPLPIARSICSPASCCQMRNRRCALTQQSAPSQSDINTIELEAQQTRVGLPRRGSWAGFKESTHCPCLLGPCLHPSEALQQSSQNQQTDTFLTRC